MGFGFAELMIVLAFTLSFLFQNNKLISTDGEQVQICWKPINKNVPSWNSPHSFKPKNCLHFKNLISFNCIYGTGEEYLITLQFFCLMINRNAVLFTQFLCSILISRILPCINTCTTMVPADNVINSWIIVITIRTAFTGGVKEEYTLLKDLKNLLLHLPVTTSSAADTTWHAGTPSTHNSGIWIHVNTTHPPKQAELAMMVQSHSLQMVHQWGSGVLYQRHTSIYSGKVTADLPGIHSGCNCALEKGLQSGALHSLPDAWRAGTCCVIHVIPCSPHCPLPCSPACPGHPQDHLHSQPSHDTFRRSRSQKPHTVVAFSVCKSGLQGDNTEQNRTTTVWFGEKLSLCWAFQITLSVVSQLFPS